MRCLVICLSVATTLSWTVAAYGAATVFTTESTATQTINSPLFGGSVSLTSVGQQVFTIRPTLGTADVTSDFTGDDFPNPLNPGEFLSYDLYNTETKGTVIENDSGTFDITFEVLFEVKITSGILTGLTFETVRYATFTAVDVATLPFPPDTMFADPTPPDTTWIYVKLGEQLRLPVGTSSNRVVTIDSIVP